NNVINRPPQPGLPGAVPGVRAGARANGASVSPAVAVAPGQGGATPTLPPSVAQKATLIQQGKLPVPPSAAINPAVKTGLTAAPVPGAPPPTVPPSPGTASGSRPAVGTAATASPAGAPKPGVSGPASAARSPAP